MVELIPKAKRPEASYPIVDTFFKISLGILGIAVIAYVAMFFFHQQKINTLEKLNQQVRGLLGSEEQKIFDTIVRIHTSVERAKEVALKMIKPNRVLSLIQDTIHPKVRILSFSLQLAEKRAALSLEAENLAVFWEQMRAFRKMSQIEDVDVGRFGIGKKGEIIFDVNINFKFNADMFAWGQSSS